MRLQSANSELTESLTQSQIALDRASPTIQSTTILKQTIQLLENKLSDYEQENQRMQNALDKIGKFQKQKPSVEVLRESIKQLEAENTAFIKANTELKRKISLLEEEKEQLKQTINQKYNLDGKTDQDRASLVLKL